MVKKAAALLAIGAVAVLGYQLLGTGHGDREVPAFYGNVEVRTVTLGFRVGGRVASLLVDEGDRVEANASLGTLDDAPYRAALEQTRAEIRGQEATLAMLEEGARPQQIAEAKARLAEQQAALRHSEHFFQRKASLHKTGDVPEQEYEDALAARDGAKARTDAAAQALALLEAGSRKEEIDRARARLAALQAVARRQALDLADTRLAAPEAGTVLSRIVEPGTVVGAGTGVFQLTLDGEYWVRAYMDEPWLGKIVPGMKVEILTDSRPDRPYHGTVGFVSPLAEFTPKSVQTPKLRTDLVYRFRVRFDDPDDGVRQGMPVTLRFPALQTEAER